MAAVSDVFPLKKQLCRIIQINRQMVCADFIQPLQEPRRRKLIDLAARPAPGIRQAQQRVGVIEATLL